MTPDTRIKWQNLGIVPTANMAFWHMYEAGVSAGNVVADYSGNGRTLQGAGAAPVLQTSVVNGQPAWYFDGTSTNHLTVDDTESPAFHYFILAAYDGAAFDAARVLVGDFDASNYLISNTSGTTFQNLGLTNFTYRKNGVAYTQANQQAPMVTFELIELITSTSLFANGIRVGRDVAVSGRWKGWFVDHMGFTQELSEVNRRRVLEYYALRYGVHLTTGSVIPLYFPSSDVIGTGVVSDGGAIRNRFYPVPRDWEPTTESYEFEDSNKTFNEFGDDPPRRWEYRYVNVSKTQAVLFDVFNDTARKANPFYFKDPEGYVWSNVRIENYSRTHEAHKRWVHEVNFNLVGYNSTATYEG